MSDAVVGIAGASAWPGQDALFAHRSAFDVLADPPSGVTGLPGLLALPERGPWVTPIARTLAIAESMPASLEPHGWRLGLSSGAELRRAERALVGDIEVLSLIAAGYLGPLAMPIVGPFSLAANLWLPVGERVIGDVVARGDLAQSLALGVLRHLAAVESARDLTAPLLTPAHPAPASAHPTNPAENALGSSIGPEEQRSAFSAGEVGTSTSTGTGTAAVRAVVVAHESLLGDVIEGAVSSFSGMSRLRPVEPGRVTATWRELVTAWDEAGAATVVQIPADVTVIRAVGAARPYALQLDPTTLDARGWEALAEQVEAGVRVRCAVVPGADGERNPGLIARSTLAPWRAIGLPPQELTLVPRPGAGSGQEASARLTLTARVALALGELLG